jgi:hypothetical protein
MKGGGGQNKVVNLRTQDMITYRIRRIADHTNRVVISEKKIIAV